MPFDYTGSFSGSFTGDITSTNGVISSSAQVVSNLPSGVVSASSQIDYRTIQNKPATISAFQKNSIVANNNFRENIYPNDSASFDSRINELAANDNTGSDAQTLSFNSATNALTISSGNSVDLSSLSGGGSGGSGLAITASDEGVTLSENVRSLDFVGNAVTATNSGNAVTITINTGSAGVSTWTELTGKPSGLVSGSSQITDVITDSYISASAAASGFGTGGGTSDFNSLINVPSGLVSSSDQILPITTSSITDFDTEVSRSAAEAGFGAGGGETYTAGNGISITSNVISIDTSSTHFRLGVSASAALYGFGSGGGGGSFGDPPVITSHGFTIPEFTGSGALIGTLVATDVTPGDTQTWAIQSGYTDNFFEVSTAGVVRAVASSSRAMNTDNTPGSGSHPFLIQVTDGQNNTVEKTIYIRVTPNSAPVFRIDGVSGNTITSFTASLDESSSAATKTQYRVYVTDADSDALTIRTGSLGTDHFSFTIGTTGVSKYIDLVQVTSSLDYENITSYSFVLTASDANYEAGYDVPNITYLPYRVEVVDNLGPGIQDQGISGVNENSTDGASAGSISATDNSNPANTILYKDFTLVSVHSGSDISNPNITSSLGGTSLTDPTADAFQMNIAGAVTRRSSVFLNSDIANRYVYRVNVGDAYNADTASALITIPISDDAASTIGANGGTYYTLESSVQGDNLTTNSNGYTISNVTFTSAVSQRWEVNTIPSGYVRFADNSSTAYTGSSATLEIDTNISGSPYSGSNTIAIQITASENLFYTTKQYRNHTLNIVENSAPIGTYSETSANLNTNGARPSNTILTLTWSDTESDSLNHNTFTFSSDADITSSWDGAYEYTITPTSNLAAGTYYVSASIKDEHGFRTGEKNTSFTIAQAPTGSLSENGTFYVIESATTGDNIVLGTNGRTGTQGDLGVSYSPQYNSAAVASFTSSNEYIGVNSSGNLTVSSSISGSVNIYPGTITSDITWRDQYDNVGGPQTITVNLAINNAPSAAELTSTNRNTNQATNGNLLSTIKWTDTESDALNISSFVLTGVSASNLSSSYDGSNNFGLYANGDQSAGTISFTASIKDVHGFRTGVYTDDITIAQADNGTLTAPGNLFIIESATSGDGITNTTTGIGTAKTLSVTYSPSYGSPIAQNFTSDNPFVAVNSSTGVLTVGTDISGSGNTDGTTLTANIGWEDQYGNADSAPITVSVTPNGGPGVTTDTPNTNNQNTNLAVNGALLATLVWSDTEGDALDVDTFNLTGAGAASLSASYAGSNTFTIHANDDLTAATYNYSANIKDTHGFNQGTYTDGITISQAGGGSITGESFYIIESALSGSVITNDSDGVGSQANVNVTYSPNYGTQVAEQFNSNHSVIAIDSNGNLSVKSDISGSYINGDSISPTIYWVDQYGNEGTGSITINVTNNVLPEAAFADETINAPVSSGTKLVTITITDNENDSPYSVTLSGAGAASMSLAPQNAASSSWFINASDSSMTDAVTLNYTASIQDAYGEDIVEYKRSFSVGAAPAGGALWYAYLTEYGHYVGVSGADIYECIGDGAFLGNTSNDGVQDADSILDSFADGDMGTEIIVDNFVSGFFGANRKTYLVGSGSLLEDSNSTPILSKIIMRTGSTDPSIPTTALLIVMPSNGDAGLVPTTMGSSFGGSTSGEYLIYGDRSGTGGDGVNSFAIQTYNMNSGTYPNSSATSFTVLIGGKDAEPSPGVDYYLISTSGSAPSSTF